MNESNILMYRVSAYAPRYMNRQGFKKKFRQNGTIPGFST